MPMHGRVYNSGKFVPWDIDNNDWTFKNDELVKHAWELFKDNGQLRD